jgi:hypothetical protein
LPLPDQRLSAEPLHAVELPPGEGLPLGRQLSAGDARFHVAERIDRCAATNVDPSSGLRDPNLPLTLRQNYGHIDCGVLLRVERRGTVRVGQTLGPSHGKRDAGGADVAQKPAQARSQISIRPGRGLGS